MWRTIWPDVRTPEGAQRTTDIGGWIVFAWAASLAARNVISGVSQGDMLGAVLAAVFIGGAAAAVGVAIRRGIRLVAGIGLGMVVAVGLVASGRGEMASPFELLGLVGTFYGVRGTFAVHRLMSQRADRL